MKKRKSNISMREKRHFIVGAFIFFAFLLMLGFTSQVNFITGNAIETVTTSERTEVTYSNSDSILKADPFNFWGEDGVETGIVRYLMFVLVFMVVFWTVAGFFNDGEDGKTPAIANLGYLVFSGIVGYLSVNFILTAEIYSVMSAYSALGLTFTLIMPFIIVFVFTSKLVSTRYISPQKIIVQRVIWATYTLFVLYYLLTSEGSSEALNWIIIGILIISILVTIFNKKFVKYVRKLHDDVKKANANARMKEERLTASETKHTALLQRVVADKKQVEETQKRLRRDVNELYGHEEGRSYY
jgi:hypothetical protein